MISPPTASPRTSASGTNAPAMLAKLIARRPASRRPWFHLRKARDHGVLRYVFDRRFWFEIDLAIANEPCMRKQFAPRIAPHADAQFHRPPVGAHQVVQH